MTRSAARSTKATSGDPRSLRNREALLDAAELLAREYPGTEKVSAGAVANRAQLSRGTFYEHFESLAGLLAATLERILDKIHEDALRHSGSQGNQREISQREILELLIRVDESPALFSCALESTGTGFQSVLAERLADHLASTIRAVHPDSSAPAVTLLANVTAGAVAGAIATRLGNLEAPRAFFLSDVLPLLPGWLQE